MKVKAWFGTVIAVLIIATTLQAQSRESLLKNVDENPVWSPSGAPKQYDEGSIDALAGKSAPSLKRYGLSGVTAQDWTSAQGTVHLTLYEMVDASAAYGFFTFERPPEQTGLASVPLGTEGFRGGNRTWFWQSKYVVKLEGEPAAVDGLAQLVGKNIFGRSRKPLVAEHLPLNNLVPGSEKYAVDAAGLDPQLGLDGATLGFGDDVEVATAQYRVDGNTASLVLMLYPTQHVAKKYADNWDSASPDDRGYRKRVGALVALVRGSRDADLARRVLDNVGYETKVTWNERRADLTLKQIIVTIFDFIGIALMLTMVAGLGFGGVRIFVKSRYPNRIFDRAADMEMIQLKLDQGLTRKEIES